MKTLFQPIYRPKALAFAVFGLLLAGGCDEFTEVELPNSQLTGVSVFETTTTANAAMANVYAKLRDTGLFTGVQTGLSNQLGHYADELTFYGASTHPSQSFSTNALVQTGREITAVWNASYNQVYACNAIIEGVAASEALPEADRIRLRGEALFVRALVHFYLANLYGPVPYVTTTDYRINTTVPRQPVAEVYSLAVADLEEAATLLPEAYSNADRAIPNRAAAKALLSRVYLYAGLWAEAANSASAVLNDTATYAWETDLQQVFLKDATTTIWQFAPAAAGRNTTEGATFVFISGPPSQASLSPALLNAFEPGDQRKVSWTRAVTNGTNTWYHVDKYEKRSATATSVEYSIVLRTAELYLIRAEARARQGELIGAKEDLDKIRSTAGLANTAAVSQDEVLEAVLAERRVELFTEMGHRFFDLKRFGKLDTALTGLKPGWNSTDALWPIPEAELLLNPNMAPQNPGY